MAKTYNPEDYSPETREAMKEILGRHFNWGQWLPPDILDFADIIEKAVLAAKQVTEEKVRAGCAAVAEAHLSNKKGDPK